MTNATRSVGLPSSLPRHLIASMRSELPSLTEEIISELRRDFPEYARPMDGPYGQALLTGVHQALSSFVDLQADPSAPHDGRDAVFRRLGRYEAAEGRSLDGLQAALIVGAQVAWRRLMKVSGRSGLSSAAMALLADSIFTYVHELATLSVDGYRQARAKSDEAQQQWRRRLLRLILEHPSVPRRAITDLAELAGWTIPAEVTPVAVQARPDDGCGSAQCEAVAEHDAWLDSDILADLGCRQPHLLLAGALTDAHRAMIGTVTAGCRVAVGLTVPLESAGDSLRWARQALALAVSGIIDDGPVTLCDKHLVTLLLLSDTALAEQVVRRQLAVLNCLTPRQQDRLTETIGAWLETRGTAAEIADRLHVHPQTVRYRLRQFEGAVGDQLANPEARFELELALRVSQLQRGAATEADAPSDG
jgi:hypothetical protein